VRLRRSRPGKRAGGSEVVAVLWHPGRFVWKCRLNGLGNHVGIPVTGREQLVGLVIAKARLGPGVEVQRPSQTVRDDRPPHVHIADLRCPTAACRAGLPRLL